MRRPCGPDGVAPWSCSLAELDPVSVWSSSASPTRVSSSFVQAVIAAPLFGDHRAGDRYIRRREEVAPGGLRALALAGLSHMARWVMKWSGAAPFQCHSPGGVWIVSPGRISITSPPRDWIRPMPSVTCTVCPVPRAAGPRGEAHHVDAHPRGFLPRRDAVVPGVPGERLPRGLHGRLLRRYLQRSSPCWSSPVARRGRGGTHRTTASAGSRSTGSAAARGPAARRSWRYPCNRGRRR